MKRMVKIVAGLFVLLLLMSSCNRYVVCPAYADKTANTEQSGDLPS